LTKDKLALENFYFDIFKFTTHVRTNIRQIIGAGLEPTKQHFILVFSALKEVEEEEFKLFIMKTLPGMAFRQRRWCQYQYASASEYKRLLQLGQWVTKNKSSDLLGLQTKFDALQIQFMALMSAHAKVLAANKPPPSSNKPTSQPKPEENEECILDGDKRYFCSTCSTRHWNKIHKAAEHKRGVGHNKNLKRDDASSKNGKDGSGANSGAANMAYYDTGLVWILCLASNDNYAITKPTSITSHYFSPTSTYIQVVVTSPFTSTTYSVLCPVYY